MQFLLQLILVNDSHGDWKRMQTCITAYLGIAMAGKIDQHGEGGLPSDADRVQAPALILDHGQASRGVQILPPQDDEAFDGQR